MRGETVQTAFGVNYIEFQSTPLIRGETQQQHPRRDRQPISIHSPHTRGDSTCSSVRPSALRFQSTPLTRGETLHVADVPKSLPISIHSPHARGDLLFRVWHRRIPNFNPLPSCEGRRAGVKLDYQKDVFQSTPLLRGETPALLMLRISLIYFNPLPSCEGRRQSNRKLNSKR